MNWHRAFCACCRVQKGAWSVQSCRCWFLRSYFGFSALADVVRYVWSCCSHAERCMVKLLFLLRDHQLADASKSRRERTLRGWICHCTALCFVSQLHSHTVVCLNWWEFWISFRFCKRSLWHSGKIPPVSSGKLCVLVWFCAGPGPVLLLFRCWFLWRNANLAGGFAGRLVSWFLFAFLVVDSFFVTYFIVQLEPVRFSRLVLIRFYLLIPITGPSLRATSAKPEEKKDLLLHRWHIQDV